MIDEKELDELERVVRDGLAFARVSPQESAAAAAKNFEHHLELYRLARLGLLEDARLNHIEDLELQVCRLKDQIEKLKPLAEWAEKHMDAIRFGLGVTMRAHPSNSTSMYTAADEALAALPSANQQFYNSAKDRDGEGTE